MAKLTLPAPARCVKALRAMVPPLRLLPLFGGEDNAHSKNADSSPTTLVHAVYQALKACALSDRPLLAGPAGGKDGKGNGGVAMMMGMLVVVAKSWKCTRLGWSSPSPPSGSAMAMRVPGE